MENVYVGIDVSQRKCDASIKDRSHNELVEPIVFEPNMEGIDKLLKVVTEVCKRLKAEPIFGMESTGIYHLPIYAELTALDYTVKVYNPTQINAFSKKSLRKTQTDKIAARTIADALSYEGVPRERHVDKETMKLREYCRIRHRLNKKASNAKRQIARDMDLIFRGYRRVFKDIRGKASRTLLKEYTTSQAICDLGEKELTKVLRTNSGGVLGQERAKKLLEACDKNIRSNLEEPCVEEIRYLLQLIELMEEQISDLDKKITKCFDQDSELMTISGIGEVNGAIIYSELGNIDDFEDGSDIVAFSGLDPSIKESGKFKGTKHHISKRGSPYLRSALYSSAVVASRCNPVCKRFYERLLARGVPKKAALCAVARKLCYIIFSVMKNKRPFYVPEDLKK